MSGLGGSVTQSPAASGISHVLVPQPSDGSSGLACLPAKLKPGSSGTAGLHFVGEGWLTLSLQHRRRQPEDKHRASVEEQATKTAGGALPAAAAGLSPQQASLAAWLGDRWRPECLEMDLIELALNAIYDPARMADLGNLAPARALKQLAKFEMMVRGANPKGPDGTPAVNNKALTYFRAAAAVGGCSYHLLPPVEPGQLPFVAEATCRKLNAILETGTCDQLERFRCAWGVCSICCVGSLTSWWASPCGPCCLCCLRQGSRVHVVLGPHPLCRMPASPACTLVLPSAHAGLVALLHSSRQSTPTPTPHTLVQA